jgi:hypothetical protein
MDVSPKRNGNETAPKLHLTSNCGIRFLRPEVVLLYKSKIRAPKTNGIFQAVVNRLDAESKEWLKNAISICFSQHHWLENL